MGPTWGLSVAMVAPWTLLSGKCCFIEPWFIHINRHVIEISKEAWLSWNIVVNLHHFKLYQYLWVIYCASKLCFMIRNIKTQKMRSDWEFPFCIWMRLLIISSKGYSSISEYKAEHRHWFIKLNLCAWPPKYQISGHSDYCFVILPALKCKCHDCDNLCECEWRKFSQYYDITVLACVIVISDFFIVYWSMSLKHICLPKFRMNIGLKIVFKSPSGQWVNPSPPNAA